MNPQCEASRELISARIDGMLSSDEEARLDEHLRGCEACRRELREMEEMVSVLRTVERLPAPPELGPRVRAALDGPAGMGRVIRWAFPPGQGRILLAAAGVFGLAVIVGIGLIQFGPEGPPRDMARQSRTTASVEAEALPSAPAEPAPASAAPAPSPPSAAADDAFAGVEPADSGRAGVAGEVPPRPETPGPETPGPETPGLEEAPAAETSMEGPIDPAPEPKARNAMRPPPAATEPTAESPEFRAKRAVGRESKKQEPAAPRDAPAMVESTGEARLSAGSGVVGGSLADVPEEEESAEEGFAASPQFDRDDRVAMKEGLAQEAVADPAEGSEAGDRPDIDEGGKRKQSPAKPDAPRPGARSRGAADPAARQSSTSRFAFSIDTASGRFSDSGDPEAELEEAESAPQRSLVASLHLRAASDGGPLMRFTLPAGEYDWELPEADLESHRLSQIPPSPDGAERAELGALSYGVKVQACEPSTAGGLGSDARPLPVEGGIVPPFLLDGQAPPVSGALAGLSATFEVVVGRQGHFLSTQLVDSGAGSRQPHPSGPACSGAVELPAGDLRREPGGVAVSAGGGVAGGRKLKGREGLRHCDKTSASILDGPRFRGAAIRQLCRSSSTYYWE